MSDIIKVQVTQEDIDDGRASNCVECPIAHAFNRVGLPRPRVGVLQSSFYAGQNPFATAFPELDVQPLPNEKIAEIRRMPESAAFFIEAFDMGLPVEPFEFECELEWL